MLALYGHPFSSYTWKAQIALHAADAAYDFRILEADQPEHSAFVAERAGPLGTFPVFVDGKSVVFETSVIVEYIALHHAGASQLLPSDPNEALRTRMLDRVFDSAVMAPMQSVVNEYIRDGQNPDQSRVAEGRAKLQRSYAWLEGWLRSRPHMDRITLVECAAAPSLFYADWVDPIPDSLPRLRAWRAHLLALPEVARCVEAARPFRSYFPLGAPDRD